MDEPLFELWKFAAALKQQPRMGWIQRFRTKKVESVADHSFGVAVLAMFEGERRHYDVESLLRLAIIHDLQEAITGDLTPRDKQNRTPSSLAKERAAAIESIISKLPPANRTSYRRLWRELETGSSREARLVKQLDKLEMGFQAKDYEKKGVDKRVLAGFYASANRRISDPVLRRALRNVVEGRLSSGS